MIEIKNALILDYIQLSNKKMKKKQILYRKRFGARVSDSHLRIYGVGV